MKPFRSGMSAKIGIGKDGMTIQILSSAVCILLGVLLLFVPQISIRTLGYVFCSALIAVGVISIVAFFLKESYRNLQNYRFAVGVMLLILGICGLLRVDELAEQLEFTIGLVSLILSILILQSTVQLKVLDSKLWIAECVLTVVSVAASVIILADVRPLLDRIGGFAYWTLLLVGAFSLVSLLLAWLGLRWIDRKESRAKKLAKKEKKANAAETADHEKTV